MVAIHLLSARVISGHPLLREAALDAAWDWKFSPTMYLGKAVKVVGAIDFNFNMASAVEVSEEERQREFEARWAYGGRRVRRPIETEH